MLRSWPHKTTEVWLCSADSRKGRTVGRTVTDDRDSHGVEERHSGMRGELAVFILAVEVF